MAVWIIIIPTSDIITSVKINCNSNPIAVLALTLLIKTGEVSQVVIIEIQNTANTASFVIIIALSSLDLMSLIQTNSSIKSWKIRGTMTSKYHSLFKKNNTLNITRFQSTAIANPIYLSFFLRSLSLLSQILQYFKTIIVHRIARLKEKSQLNVW